MNQRNEDRIPVIVGVGEYVDRPEDPQAALEPLALMGEAVKAAERDSSVALLGRVDSVDLVGLISWRYVDPVGALCERLNIAPARATNASMGGETPVRLLHEAALRITQGKQRAALIVGGEALHARQRAKKANVKLNWTPLASAEEAVRYPATGYPMSDLARRLGVTDPAHIYPLYEMAAQSAWSQNPKDGQAESAELWSSYAAVASGNPSSWLNYAPSPSAIAAVGSDNRLVSWPYPKLMVANPSVNQAAAVIVMSLAEARAAGVPDDRMIHIWGGAAASEPDDYLLRDRYDRSTAQEAVLNAAAQLAGGTSAISRFELYSCFPVVAKMAVRTLGLDPERMPTVTGGLTFFGGPLNNYMNHAICEMTRLLRRAPEEIGLLYGQGGFFNKHHALVVSRKAASTPLAAEYSVQQTADAKRDPVPALVENYEGTATVETYTVLYGRDGEPIDGIVVVRTPEGGRTMARVPANDTETLDLLLSTERSAIGAEGYVSVDIFGKPQWRSQEAAAKPRAPYRYCTVEREGALTIVTIMREEVRNAVHPAANGELAEIFDNFAADPDQWVAILTGAGDKAFCAGNDLVFTAKAMARGAPIEEPTTGYAGLTARFDLEKPVIAAVNGVAMGGGFEIALACDLIIAAESATFALPEPKVGIAALAGGLLRLPPQIGLKRAMSMILTGRPVSAKEGETLGFVNEVVANGDLMAAARRWAEQIMACSPMSIRASKQIALRGLQTTLPEAYRAQLDYPATRTLFRSQDIREGPRAFAEKRPPRWHGR